MNREVREMARNDIKLVIDYFTDASPEFLRGMGADPNKLPNKKDWAKRIETEWKKENKNKQFYYIIWLINNQPVGHSNINQIQFQNSAFMHLHLWKNDNRQKGMGTYFIKRTIPYFFNNFELEELYCEPYALNPAPNKTLLKLGFEFVKEYETTPGWINLHQKVNQWVMTRKSFEEEIKTVPNNG